MEKLKKAVSIDDDNNINDTANANSPILLTEYSSEASQLIKSFTKFIPFVVIILISITAMTTFDLIKELGFFTNMLTDKTIDAMIIAVYILLIIFLILTIWPVMKSEKIIDKWSNLFEKNAIRTGILLTINNRSKEEVLKALSETIEEIGSLQHYLRTKSAAAADSSTEFYDINVNDVIFDILIDKSTIKPNINSDSLRNAIQDYGSILIKLTEETIDKNLTQRVIGSLQKYRNQGNKIGLAMIIGESITNESYDLVDKIIKDKAISESLILIEKPTANNNNNNNNNNQVSDLKNLNNILTP